MSEENEGEGEGINPSLSGESFQLRCNQKSTTGELRLSVDHSLSHSYPLQRKIETSLDSLFGLVDDHSCCNIDQDS